MTNPTCPVCGALMDKKTKRGTTFNFWGCSKWADTKCKGYRPFVAEKIQKVAMPTNVVGTPEQEAIWLKVVNSAKHMIIEAVAGSGKTFTAVQMLTKLSGKRVAFTAFNKHIAEELQARVPDGVDAFTLHSFGFSMVKGKFGKRIEIDGNKLDGIISEFVPEDDNTQYISNAIRKLVELCKYNMFDGTNEAELDELVLMHSIDLNSHTSQVYTIVPQVIRESAKRTNVVDFTDMLWFIYIHNIPVTNYDVFIVDEIQDLNPLQQFVALKAIGTNGRFIGVGDTHQAIYGFSGADVYSIQNLTDVLSKSQRGVETMPLTASRRCPISHVALAAEIVPHLTAMPEAKLGEVYSVELNKAVDMMEVGDMGVCRRNAPLIAIAYALIREGKPAMVKGRDIGQGMLALIRKLKATTIAELVNKSETYRKNEIDKLRAKGKRAESAILSLNDRIDTLIALTDGIDNLSELRAKIESLFSDEKGVKKIVLSSVHKSKGLEASTVFVFDYARIELNLSQEWQQKQERHLHYISLTRSTNKLVLVD